MKKLNKFIFVLLSVCSMNAFAYPVTGEMPEKLKTFTENLESVSATFKQTKILPCQVPLKNK